MHQRVRKYAVGAVIVGAAIVAPMSASAQAAPAVGAPTTQPSTTAPASEKNMAEAKSRYKAGMTLYDDGAYDAARVQFERAYELAPSYRILYNIGLVYKQLNEFVGALKALQGYLKEGGSEVTEERKAEVNKLIDSLSGVIGSATVTVNVAGAEVTVDDAVVATSPTVALIPLNPGKRKIGAKMAGRIPDTKVVTIASGDKINVDLTLQDAQTTIVKSTDVRPIIAWAATGALAIGAGVTGYMALSSSNELEDLQKVRNADTNGTLSKRMHDEHTKMETLSLVSDILLASTVVAAGVSVYFTWFASKPKEKERPTDKGTETASVRFNMTPGGAAVFGTF